MAAERRFKSLISLPSGSYLELSQWYLILICLKEDKRGLMEEFLQMVIEDKNQLVHQKAVEVCQLLY